MFYLNSRCCKANLPQATSTEKNVFWINQIAIQLVLTEFLVKLSHMYCNFIFHIWKIGCIPPSSGKKTHQQLYSILVYITSLFNCIDFNHQVMSLNTALRWRNSPGVKGNTKLRIITYVFAAFREVGLWNPHITQDGGAIKQQNQYQQQ